MPSSPEPRGAAAGRRATVVGALLEGWRRILRAPLLTLGILVLTFVAALPLALVLRGMLDTSLGQSLEAARAQYNWDPGWLEDFAPTAQGVGTTFTREVVGFGGTLATLSRLLDAAPLPAPLVGSVCFYVAAWIFLSGGILDRIARARPVRTGSFFAASGVFFFRFARLAGPVAATYWVLFRWIHPWLFDVIYGRWTRDLTNEHTAIVLRSLLYGVFLALLMGTSVVADFAKVRAVVEDRRSMISAIAASIRFIRRRFWRVIGLYLLNVLLAVILMRFWLQLAPPGWGVNWPAFLATQLYLLLRIWAKLAFMASEVVFFQGELAHAQYTALPEPAWPDSPAVESIS